MNHKKVRTYAHETHSRYHSSHEYFTSILARRFADVTPPKARVFLSLDNSTKSTIFRYIFRVHSIFPSLSIVSDRITVNYVDIWDKIRPKCEHIAGIYSSLHTYYDKMSEKNLITYLRFKSMREVRRRRTKAGHDDVWAEEARARQTLENRCRLPTLIC